MLRTITPLASVLFFVACSGNATSPEHDDVTSTARAELAAFDPAFVVEGATQCANLDGAGGIWTARAVTWTPSCSLGFQRVLDGCGYAWSGTGGAPADVDRLATVLGASVMHLVPTRGNALWRTAMCRLAAWHVRPMPGSTPCGACRAVGIATPSRAYLSFDMAFDQDTTLLLELDTWPIQSLSVRVPAHTLTYEAPVALGADSAGSVSVWWRTSDGL